MKPILFNTEMVRALLDGRKSVTRRVVKPQPTNPRFNNIGWLGWDDGHGYKMRQPYQPGDILYVRETWAECEDTGGYLYRAWPRFEPKDEDEAMKRLGLKWRPSIHMPKEAARLFLRVTGVWVERLHDMTANQAMDEGFQDWNDVVRVWDSTIKKADLPLYGWAANPWVWVIEFERISKEALKGGEGNG